MSKQLQPSTTDNMCSRDKGGVRWPCQSRPRVQRSRAWASQDGLPRGATPGPGLEASSPKRSYVWNYKVNVVLTLRVSRAANP